MYFINYQLIVFTDNNYRYKCKTLHSTKQSAFDCIQYVPLNVQAQETSSTHTYCLMRNH